VQASVYVPEGRVLHSVDTVVPTAQWTLPAPITVPRAAVKLLVSRNCPDLSVQDLQAKSPHFFVDTTQRCSFAAPDLVQVGSELRWHALAAAHQYSVNLFAANAGHAPVNLMRNQSEHVVRDAHWRIPASLWTQADAKSQRDAQLPATQWVATVQAHCGALRSQPHSVVLQPTPQ
jgi:hypothetical protein